MQSKKIFIIVVAVLLSASCIPKTGIQLAGGGEGTVTGGAGSNSTGGSSGSTRELSRCPESYGAVVLAEPETFGKISDPRPMLNLIIAQSGCFQVVSRGHAMSALEKERRLSASGELATDIGKKKVVAVDYVINPSIIFSDPNAGGTNVGGLLGALLPGAIGVAAGGLSSKTLEVQVTLELINLETQVQEAVAEGRANKSDMNFSLGGGLAGGGLLGGAKGGAYDDTHMNKIIVAAFVDAYNKLVIHMR